ncbi:MAG: hypothetical protein R3B13_37475 [Polyangiaceae bacterium]
MTYGNVKLRNSPGAATVVVSVVCLQWATACSDADAPQNLSRSSREYQENLVSRVSPVQPTILDEHQAVIKPTQTGTMAKPSWENAGDGNEQASPSPPGEVTQFDVEQQVRRQLRYNPAALSVLAEQLVPAGIADAVRPDAIHPVAPQSVTTGWSAPYSWSNGVDDRVDLSSATGWHLNTIGRLWGVGGCTATFFGRRLAITAAHCIVDSAGNYVAGVFIPAVKGASWPYSIQNVVGAWWGGQYIAKCTNGAPGYWSDCVPEDWALILLEDNFPLGHPGWMGFAWLGESDIQSWNKSSIGYPGCFENNSPANCQQEHRYGQFYGCTFGQFLYPRNGFNNGFTHGCDNGPGHSGSGIFTTGLGSFHIFGVDTNQRCTTCTIAEEPNSSVRLNPALDKRLDSFIFNLMVNLRAVYP